MGPCLDGGQVPGQVKKRGVVDKKWSFMSKER